MGAVLTMLKGRQLAEAQASLRWFTVLATPANGSIGGVLGLSEFSSAQITFLDAEFIGSLKGKHHLGTSKPSHTKPSLLAWTNSSLATCLWDAWFPDAHSLWLLMNLEQSGMV